MSNLLAIESSSSLCSVALAVGDNVVDVKVEDGKRTHTQFMLPFVDELLQSNNVTVSDLSAIAFSAGPGSFTGIRLATSVAKSLAYAANIPVVSVSSLAAIAQAFYRTTQQAEQCLVITDARMGEVYCAEYGCDENGMVTVVKPDTLMKIEELNNLQHSSRFAVGDAWQLLGDIEWLRTIQQISLQADASDVLMLARQKFQAGESETALQAQAIYLRDKTSWKTTAQQKSKT